MEQKYPGNSLEEFLLFPPFLSMHCQDAFRPDHASIISNISLYINKKIQAAYLLSEA